MADPRISIIIPTYQHAAELPRCLASIFAQTFTDFEVIVINDGSTDGTEAALAPYRDRITYVAQENRGGNAARNRGASLARGAFLLFCDADVLMRPDMLARMLAVLEAAPAASYAYSSFRFGWKRFRLWPFDADRLRRMNYIHTTSLLRREHFPGFDESVRRLQDWDLWLTMLAAGRTGVWIPEELFQCLPHKGGISLWVPGVFYRIPWKRFGLHVDTVEKFHAAREVLAKKHGLLPFSSVRHDSARLTLAVFAGILLAWNVSWWCKANLLDPVVPWLANGLGGFLFWTAAKLLLWVAPAWWLLARSSRTLADVLRVREWRRWLPWGLAVGGAIAITGFWPKVNAGQPLLPATLTVPLFSVLTVSPIFEEFLMRGAVLRGLSTRYRPFTANVMAAAMFVLLHMPGWYFMGSLGQNMAAPVGGALSIFLLGNLFGIAAQYGGSPLAAMVAHFLNNLASS